MVEVVRLRGYRRADWDAVPLGACVACGRPAKHRHHAVYKQHVVRYGGDRWDPANQVQLCVSCHANAHQNKTLALTTLPDGVLRFAFALIGPAAGDYLRRRYWGDDPRLLSMNMERTYPKGA